MGNRKGDGAFLPGYSCVSTLSYKNFIINYKIRIWTEHTRRGKSSEINYFV